MKKLWNFLFSRKLWRFLSSRIFILGAMLLLQFIFIIATVILLNDQYWMVSSLTTLLSIILIVLLINNQEQNPSTRLVWIFVIMLLPIVGTALYLMFGSRYASRRLRQQVQKVSADARNIMPDRSQLLTDLEAQDPAAASQFKYLMRMTDIPPFAAGQTEYFTSGEALFPRLLEELQKAQKYIFIESFIITEGLFWGSILDILTEKAASGVDVRVMYDDAGCINTLPPNYHQKLTALGIKCTVFNPIKAHLDVGLNNRDHRKIIVIDGQKAIVGGINLADEYINRKKRYGYWKDSAMLLSGESVYGLTTIFLQNWNLFNPRAQLRYTDYYQPPSGPDIITNGYIQPFYDHPFDDEHVGESAFINMINAANRYIYINTPYFIVDNELLMALTLAAKRGVDVRICTPHIPDKWYVHMMTQAYYEPMLKAGIKVLEFRPGFNHTKSIVSDDRFAFVGTINCDYRSFYHHFECGVLMYNTSAVETIKRDFQETEKHCVPAPHSRLSLPMRLLRSIMRLLTPLM